MPYFGSYISSSGAQAILRHKYKGSDDSLVLKYVTNPIYEKIVVLFPTWVAPNLITVAGLLFTAISHALLAYYAPGLKDDPSNPVPSWVYFYSSVAVLAYQALDAMDGKQARRTKSGSALGLLMDHGCDAVNTTVMSLSLSTALQLGGTLNAALVSGVAALGFFFATLEEYYTGELHLPIINGPNEGIHIMSAVLFLTGWFGPSFWTAPASSFGCTRGEVVMWTSVVFGLITCLSNFYNIFFAVREKRTEIENEKVQVRAEVESNTLSVAVTRALPLFLTLAFSYTWVVHSPSNIMARYPRTLLWVLGLVMAKLVVGIMVAHLCEAEYHPFSKTIAVFLFLAFHAAAGCYMFPGEVEGRHEDLLLFEMAALMIMSMTHMVAVLAHEVSSVLGIYVFIITRKRPKTAYIQRLLRPSFGKSE